MAQSKKFCNSFASLNEHAQKLRTIRALSSGGATFPTQTCKWPTVGLFKKYLLQKLF